MLHITIIIDKRNASTRFVLSSAVILSLCARGTGISDGDGDTDRRDILHDRTYRSKTCLLPFRRRYP